MTEAQHVYAPMRKACPQVHWNRLENLVGTGAPDANGCLNGVEAWIENKIVHGNQIRFQPTQPAWIIQRLMHGGRVFVLARKDDVLMLYQGDALFKLVRSVAPHGKHLTADYRAGKPLLFPQPFQWGVLLQTVFGHMATRPLTPQ